MRRALFTFVPALGLLAAGIASASPPAPSAAPSGAQVYTRCAACHLASGAGVPGAFPPLNADVRALANRPDGRRYLALAVIKGLSGPLVVEGKTYQGVMPSHAMLDDAAVAAVLTHVTGTIAKTGRAPRAFTRAEVAASRAAGASLDAAAVARSQPKLTRR